MMVGYTVREWITFRALQWTGLHSRSEGFRILQNLLPALLHREREGGRERGERETERERERDGERGRSL